VQDHVVEQGDEADEAFGDTVAGTKVPPHARAGRSDAGTASQLIPGVELNRYAVEVLGSSI